MTMLYEAFMAEYGLMPDDADERFSFRQMSVLVQARNDRKKNEATLSAVQLSKVFFGDKEADQQPTGSQERPKMLTADQWQQNRDRQKPKEGDSQPYKHVGIKVKTVE
jgi:hypothetical protein